MIFSCDKPVCSVSHAHFVKLTLLRVLVPEVENLLFVIEPTIVVTQVRLVERLWLVVSESVRSANLVSMLVAFGAPS